MSEVTVKALVEGDRVPAATFRSRAAGEWRNRTTEEVFARRNVVLFALPGAFTPTCSGSQVPGYEAYAEAFYQLGIDEIVCVSVNDGFVMQAWGDALGVDKVQLLADGNAEFTRGMGMLVDKAELGFGARSWRYAMLVRDGVIERMFDEPRVPGDPYGVSSPEAVLEALAPGRKPPDDVVLVTREGCGHCGRARAALAAAGKVFEEVQLGAGRRGLSNRGLKALSGRSTTPQVFINGVCIGGADELEARLAVAVRLT